MKKAFPEYLVFTAILSACTSVQIEQFRNTAEETYTVIKSSTTQFLHENGSIVRNDPARAFDPMPYRTNIPDRQLSAISPVLNGRVFHTPEYLPDLVKALLTGVNDPVRQAKILHDWIAMNISYDAVSFSKKEIPDQEYASVLKSRMAVCEGYANLYLEMCSLADIKCQKVSGYARGVGFNPLVTENISDSNHAWNAILLKGNWYLVDTTWDSGHVKGKGPYSFSRSYSTEYFLLDPKYMLYTHLPSISMWQLLDPPLSNSEFVNLPHLRGSFFDTATILDTSLASNNIVNATATLNLSIKTGKRISTHLLDDKAVECKGSTFITKVGDTTDISMAFPRAGTYTLELFSGDVKASTMTSIGEIVYTPTSGNDFSFPEQLTSSIGNEITIISPKNGRVKRGQETVFEFAIPSAKSASLLVGKDYRVMTRNPDGNFSLAITAYAQGEKIALLLPKNSSGTSFEYVLVYSVVD